MRRSVIWVLGGLVVGLFVVLCAYIVKAPHGGQAPVPAGNVSGSLIREEVVIGGGQDNDMSGSATAPVKSIGATQATETVPAVTAPLAVGAVPSTSVSAPPASPSTAEGFRNAVIQFQESLQDHKRSLHQFGPSDGKQLMQHHRALQQLVYAACGQWGSFPRVRSELAPYIDWREIPKMPHDAGSETEPYLPGYGAGRLEESAIDALPMVYFLDCDGRGARATVMVDVLVTKGSAELLSHVQSAPFSASNVEGRLYFSPDIVHRDPSPGPPVSNASVQIVGTVDVQQPLPAVVVMQENYTSSAPVGFSVCGFNVADGKWHAAGPDGWTGIDGWQYESEGHKLTLFKWDQVASERVVSEVVDMREWVAQHGPWKQWK